MQNLVLFGFMGTGKSLISKKMTKILLFERIDMDSVIEEREHKTISEIFAHDGEAYFRQLEHELVKELAQRQDLIISTGGGVVLNRDSVTAFAKTGVCICLNTSPEIIYERVKSNSSRPLLMTENPLQTIKQLLESRKEYYAHVPYQLVTDNKDPEDICAEIMEIYNNHVSFALEE